MNTAVPSRNPISLPVPEFGRSADGMLVARVGDAANAMIPTADERHYLGSGWRVCQSACNTDPLSASNFDPIVSLGFGSGPTELVM